MPDIFRCDPATDCPAPGPGRLCRQAAGHKARYDIVSAITS
ncbi:MAG: hypothetical protein ACP59X_06815 [Solidesulfovibrio sp. DCME]